MRCASCVVALMHVFYISVFCACAIVGNFAELVSAIDIIALIVSSLHVIARIACVCFVCICSSGTSTRSLSAWKFCTTRVCETSCYYHGSNRTSVRTQQLQFFFFVGRVGIGMRIWRMRNNEDMYMERRRLAFCMKSQKKISQILAFCSFALIL